MEINDIHKKLSSLLTYKIPKIEIEKINQENLNIFIDKIITDNNKEIDLEIFSFTNGKLNNISEYYEEYKNQELKPLSGKHYLLLLENNLLQKLKTN